MFKKRVYSDALDEMLQFKMTTHVMRCIDKAGGIDNYLLSKKRFDLDSVVGQQAKERIKKALEKKASKV